MIEGEIIEEDEDDSDLESETEKAPVRQDIEIRNKEPAKVLLGHKKSIRDIAYSEK